MAKAKPTANQLAFMDWEFGAFFHFGLRAFYKGWRDWDERDMDQSAFNPDDLDCESWVKAFKDAGAGYICLTTRHHDGFSMWHTRQSDYNIVDATPFGRDILKELADECHAQGIRLHLYYSHIDWGRDD